MEFFEKRKYGSARLLVWHLLSHLTDVVFLVVQEIPHYGSMPHDLQV